MVTEDKSYLEGIEFTPEEAAFGKLHETYEAEEAALCQKLNDWCTEQDLPHLSADEIYFEDGVTDAQRDWLTEFMEQWEDWEKRSTIVWDANCPHSSSWSKKCMDAWTEYRISNEDSAQKNHPLSIGF